MQGSKGRVFPPDGVGLGPDQEVLGRGRLKAAVLKVIRAFVPLPRSLWFWHGNDLAVTPEEGDGSHRAGGSSRLVESRARAVRQPRRKEDDHRPSGEDDVAKRVIEKPENDLAPNKTSILAVVYVESVAGAGSSTWTATGPSTDSAGPNTTACPCFSVGMRVRTSFPIKTSR